MYGMSARWRQRGIHRSTAFGSANEENRGAKLPCLRRFTGPPNTIRIALSPPPAKLVISAHCAAQSDPETPAKQMISGASYGPEALKVIGQAFDEVIAGHFLADGDGNTRSAARARDHHQAWHC